MRSTAFSSFPRSPHQLSISATGQIGKQIGSWMGQDYNPYESEYKISEMINPDGSVTVRKRILNPDGSSRILQQEYSSLDRRILGKIDNETYEEELLPTLDRSFSGSESSPARTLSSDRSGQGSAFSIQRTEQLVMDHSFERVRQSADIPTSLRRSNIEDSYWTPDEAAAEEDPDEGESQSSMSSIPMDASGDSPKLVGLQRPTNPVPFERKFMTDPSILSIISSGINETDISAISGDSMGYPVADTSTALHEEHNEISDDDTLWSLLNDDEPAEASSNSITRGIDGENIQQLPPYGQKITPVAAQGTPARHSDRSSMSKGSSSSAKKSLHSDLIILKQATVIEKPKPHVRYYVDPKISGNRDRLRAQGALFDIPESAQDTSSVNSTPEEHIVVTVRKQSLNDKIGVFVGVCQLPCGPRLVVTKVSPSGKFAESPIENGDIVVSINGKNFLDNPNSEEALDIVRRAGDRITFVVLKGRSETAKNTSRDDFSVPSLPFHHVSEVVHADGSKVLTRETRNDDGSQTLLMEFFDIKGHKQKQTTRRRWISSNGSTRDISLTALSLNGELAVLVKKTRRNQMVGLKLERKRSHRGRDELVVSQVLPSGLFARTPLSVGDQILSINGVDFSERADTAEALSIFSKAEEDVMIRAWKSREWIERRQQRLAQTRQLVETFTIPPPKCVSPEFDDSSYGGSTFGYQSAKKLTLKNFAESERLEFAVKCHHTHFGALLVAQGVSPSSRLAAIGLQNGDVILSINGVDLRKEGDTSRAMNLIQSSDGSIEIEYQRLGDSYDEEESQIQRQESFAEDGTKCIRTETRNPDGSISVMIEEIGPGNPVDVGIGDRSSLSRQSDVSVTSGRDGSLNHRSWNSSSFTLNKLEDVKASKPLFITVYKTSLSQDVGIRLEASGDGLHVKTISPSGLLVGKPILPGDKILSINSHDFRTSRNVRKAKSIISQSTKVVSFEILKATALSGVDTMEYDATKNRRRPCICCTSRDEHHNRVGKSPPTSPSQSKSH